MEIHICTHTYVWIQAENTHSFNMRLNKQQKTRMRMCRDSHNTPSIKTC